MAVSPYDLTLGPMTIGVNLNFFLTGITAYQFARYCVSDYRDTWFVKCVVGWIMVINIFHTAACGYSLWDYTITHFDDPSHATTVDWVYLFSPAFIGFCSTPVQLFLAWRVYTFSKNRWLYWATAITAVTQGLAAVATSLSSMILQTTEKTHEARLRIVKPIVYIWFPLQVTCDIILTCSLVWTLNKSKTGYHGTDHVLTRLIRASLETAFFVTLFVILETALWFAYQSTHVHMIFAITTGQVYANAFLSTLNSRSKLRDELGEPTTFRVSMPLSTLSHSDRETKPHFDEATGQGSISVHPAVKYGMDHATSQQSGHQNDEEIVDVGPNGDTRPVDAS